MEERSERCDKAEFEYESKGHIPRNTRGHWNLGPASGFYHRASRKE
jgi:hypothetical protein